MMGRSHAASGWCAGAAIAPQIGMHRLPEVITFATVTAGFALLPDLDHPSASATKSLGLVTGTLSRILRWCSHVAYEATKGPRDEKGPGKHRHLTHTVVFAGVLGVGTWIGTTVGGAWATFAVLLFGILLAQLALGPTIRRVARFVGLVKRRGKGSTDHLLLPLGGGAAYLVHSDPQWYEALHAASGQIGVAVALGCIVHCFGDALTESGCPFLWPIPIAGETWYELGLPKALRFKTDGRVERWALFPAFIVAGILLIPGVWPALWPELMRVVNQHDPGHTKAAPHQPPRGRGGTGRLVVP